MDKIKHKPEKKKILDFIEQVDWLFDVNNYTKTLCYPAEDKEKHGGDVMADITTDNTYRTITVNIYPIFFTKDKETQCRTLIHELSHTITEDLFDCYNNMYNGTYVPEAEARHAREKTTEQVAYLLYSLGIGKKQYFSKAIKEYLK